MLLATKQWEGGMNVCGVLFPFPYLKVLLSWTAMIGTEEPSLVAALQKSSQHDYGPEKKHIISIPAMGRKP